MWRHGIENLMTFNGARPRASPLRTQSMALRLASRPDMRSMSFAIISARILRSRLHIPLTRADTIRRAWRLLASRASPPRPHPYWLARIRGCWRIYAGSWYPDRSGRIHGGEEGLGPD